MNLSDRIIVHEVDGVEKTCVRLGSDKFTIPRHLMQGEKQHGYIYKDGQLTPWYWGGVCAFDEKRWVYFDKIKVYPITEISTTFRHDALKILINAATALSLAGSKFADLDVGLIPLWRLLIIDEDTLLILPHDLSDIFSIFFEDAERYQELGAWAKGDTEQNFALIRQFGELMYYALTNISPYEDRKIRDFGYKEMPLEFYQGDLFPSLDAKTIGFINFILHAKSREQRDIMGNRTGVDNIPWFIERASRLSWDVDNITKEKQEEVKAKVERLPETEAFWEKTAEGAKRHNFWRTRGSVIIISVIVAVLVGSFLGNYLYNIFKPPVTRDMSQREIIEYFFDAQSKLDVTALDEPFKGASAPQETEVINLYVTTQTRRAYESLRRMTAEDWVEAGKPAVDGLTIIYGPVDINITQIDENVYEVNYLIYTPYSYAEEDELVMDESATGMPLYAYDARQVFTFTWNNRGWWNITDLTNAEVSLREAIYVPIAGLD